MKLFVVLCIVLVTEIYAAYVPLPPDHTDSNLEECRKTSEFTDDNLNKMKTNPFVEDGGEIFKKFIKCYLEKTGAITEDGKLNVDEALPKLGPNFAKKIFEHCKTHVETKGEEFVVVPTTTASDYSECFRQGVSNYIWNAKQEGFEPFTYEWQK
uniref:Odorant-binding protein 8 n=1 Tax=Mythimna separata TaxID=271217 RepID=A0A5H2N7I1_MYTSE|nr:odorant-binding protein 8 [Mythimna separata]